ncbi:hypothetical protein BV25DRAFT_1052911 [Artomyces pyxidatus]|uniref:Uncharacterized protein n=1 Tax=Artomyces pyxidatus TaxID=48021 RepID=A0ACB8STY1_9AGAM|nr:hypothetical protein BV25DRAFT_1052911 [Artomyces pyxidatus]
MSDTDIPPFIPPDEDVLLDDHDEEVATVHLLQSPPRKRARVHEEDDDMKPSPRSPSPRSPSEIVRDDTFYLSDGSCILLVQNTLFNVHRTILSKDSSSFGTMFSLPQGINAAEGQSDDNPIILSGDTVAEFRNFLWALYALPHELILVHSTQNNLPRLMDIARVANKYSFKSLETWALDVIVETVTRKTSSSHPFPNVPSSSPQSSHGQSSSQGTHTTSNDQTIALVRLAQLCNHERLLNTMVESLRKLMTSSLQNAYMAMTLADELDLRVLRGAAYLEVMQKAMAAVVVYRHEHQAANLHQGQLDNRERLIVSPMQHMRLLSGYHRLSLAWEELRLAPPTFEHAPSCGLNWHQGGCVGSWSEFWREKSKSDAVLGLGLADVLGRLRAVLKEFDKWGSATYMHHDCRMLARRAINDKLKSIQDTLPDYFSDDD